MSDIVERLRGLGCNEIEAEAADEIERLRAEVAGLREDAERWRYAKSIARQNTEHDVFGNGGLWMIGVHSDDNRLSLDAAIDAARGEA